jgi:RNA polymerase sigma-70 factor (sigma-E family)
VDAHVGRARVAEPEPPRLGRRSGAGLGPVNRSRLAGVNEGVGSSAKLPPKVAVDREFEAFVERGSARLLRSAFLLTGDRELAQDLLQAVLIRTARRWEVASRAPDAYAHRVLVNLLHDRRRLLGRRVTERPLDDRGEQLHPVPDPAGSLVDRFALMEAVRQLPQRQREVLVLRFFADLSVAETADAIGASPGTVKTHTSRALATLRVAMADHTPESAIPKSR